MSRRELLSRGAESAEIAPRLSKRRRDLPGPAGTVKRCGSSATGRRAGARETPRRSAVISDCNGDGRNDLCFQSGYQQKGIAGDLEFHARMNNNTAMAGTQYVTWCSDSDRDGCSDEWNRSIRIDWSADGTATYSDGSSSGGGGDYGSWYR